jgi:hypothetical protein
MITRTMPVGRPMVRPAPRPVHKNAPHPAPKSGSNRTQILVGGLIGLAVLIALTFIYVYGTAGTIADSPLPRGVTGPAAAPTGRVSDKTTVYRAMKDGRMVIMEIDKNGTRVIGTVSKGDVPLASDPDRDPRPHAPDTAERLNAFSQTFK